MATSRVSISLGERDLQWLREQAEARGTTVPVVLRALVRQARREDAIDDVLRWLNAPELTDARLDDYRRLWNMD